MGCTLGNYICFTNGLSNREVNMRQNELPRFKSAVDVKCYKCEESIEAGEIFAMENKHIYCECCVEDYEEEGRPL